MSKYCSVTDTERGEMIWALGKVKRDDVGVLIEAETGLRDCWQREKKTVLEHLIYKFVTLYSTNVSLSLSLSLFGSSGFSCDMRK